MINFVCVCVCVCGGGGGRGGRSNSICSYFYIQHTSLSCDMFHDAWWLVLY